MNRAMWADANASDIRPPTNIPVTSLGSPQGIWLRHFWKTFRRKWGLVIMGQQEAPAVSKRQLGS